MVQDFFLKYAAATTAVILIFEPFLGGVLSPEMGAKGKADALSNARYRKWISK